MMNGISTILSSLATPIYGSLVDITGSYYLPNIISLGLGITTVIVLALIMKETYGIAVVHIPHHVNDDHLE
jgi:hypothetical protein